MRNQRNDSYSPRGRQPGGNTTFDLLKDADTIQQRELKNTMKFRNQLVPKFIRPCLHGYREPAKMWKSKLEEAMEDYERKHRA